VGRRTAATVRGGVGRDLALITLAGLVLRLLFVANPGHIVDLNTFGQWALEAADNPLDRAYEATNANYPPGAILVFELIGRTYRALGLSDPVSLRIAVKAPSIVFDCLGGGVLFALAARFVGPRRALVAAALFDLNPAIIYDSSLWGQNDSITTVSALTAVWCLLAGRPVSAWIILAFAILNKPPVIVLVPLFWIHAFAGMGGPRRRHAFIQTAIGTVAALVFGYLIALPLYAVNVYALFGSFFAPDDVRVLFVPIKYWADAAFGAIAAVLYWRYGRMRDDHTFLEAGFLVLLAFFLVLTEMHERYLIYALTFAPALAPLDRRYLWATLVLTLTQWLNLEYSLTYMWVESDKPAGIDPHEFAPVLVHLCALANIAIFGLGVRIFFEPRATLRRAKGTVAGKL
jgi:dolichyl-phosphate-mannose-protein mannosyltransferase